jgi:hypothetical protein
LVDGQLWTDESVFWQLKVKDRGEYEVVHRKLPPPPLGWFYFLMERETMVLPNLEEKI